MQLGFLLALAGQVTSADVVDARGNQDVVFKAPATGMYRVRVQSDAGTACAIADHLRGPFASGGVIGTQSCDLDLLLDAGLYKARLSSPEKGKGKAKLEAVPFTDVTPAVRLDDNRSMEVRLKPREQLSAWMRIEKRRSVTLEIAGRTAGKVSLWRDGQWLEDLPIHHTDAAPRPGKGIHRWRMDAVLEPGDYELVVYGTSVKSWTKGPEEDVAFITRGAESGSAARSQAFTIPSWGFTQIAVPFDTAAAFVQLDTIATEPVVLSAEAVRFDSALGPVRSNSPIRCTIAAGAPLPSCSVTSSAGTSGTHILTIDGAPGTKGELTWGPLGNASTEGYWSASSTPDMRINADGTYFVSAPALPLSMDAEPLGCAIDQVDEKTSAFVRRVATDAPVVSWTVPFERKFNYGATSTSVWVQIDKPGLYEVKGDDATKASCEVFHLEGWKRDRLGAGEDGKCSQTRALGPGLHEIRFYGGRAGIQTLRIAQLGLGGIKAVTPAKSSCSFDSVALLRGSYRLATSSAGGAQLRAFFARPLAADLTAAVPVAIDPGRPVTIAFAPGAAVVVRARPGLKLGCALDGVALSSSGGTCRTAALPAGGKLVLTNGDAAPLMVVVGRVEPPPVAVSAPRYDPAIMRLPSISAAAPEWMTFDRSQQRSMTITVDKPGLYDLATEGLLATSCRLRTPTIGKLAQGDQNGRGRNCLVQAYLKQGTYLFTAQAQGQSKGSAAVRLVQRAPRDLGVVPVGEDVFFRVAAGELAQQTLDVKKDATVAVASNAQGAPLSCRIDDHDGWPLMAVPTDCNQQLTLEAGRYLLTALPLTVDSRRRTSLTKAIDAVVLEGEATHALALNRRYQAQLGTDGKDAFTFTLGAEMDVGIELDHQMQARLLRVTPATTRDGKTTAATREIVDTIAPVGGGAMSLAGSDDAGDDDGDGDSDEGEESEYEGSEGEDEYGEYEGGEGEDDGYAERLRRQREEQERAQAAAVMARATSPQDVGGLSGAVRRLPAGTYVLETEHSRGDVAIRYGVKVGVRTLAPGVVLTVPVPGRVEVAMPKTTEARAGLLRIKTRGDVDVRCRLRAADGAVVAESADSGADWNCALAVPLGAGTYTLTLEAETLQPGVTELSAAFLEAKDTGDLKDGNKFTVVGKVASAPIPSAAADIVHDVSLTSEQDFSCAVQDAAGTMLDRKVSVRACRFLLWPGDEKQAFRVFVWTPDRKADVKAAFTSRKITRFSGGALDGDEVGRAHVDARGRFATGAGALCRQTASKGGVLVPCDGGASFVPGDVLVALPKDGRIDWKEQVAAINDDVRTEERRTLEGPRAFERQRAKGKRMHLVEVTAPFGSAASPSCALEGGLATHAAVTCAAATGPLEETTLTTWTRPGGALDATIARRAVAWPSSVQPLAPGRTSLSWTDESVRYALPSAGFRLQLAMPSGAWAVLLDDAGAVRDLCSPRRAPTVARSGALSTCVLRGTGGHLVLASTARVGLAAVQPLERQARADLVVLATAEAPRALVGLRETKPSSPGRERVLVAAAPVARALKVEGWGVLACAVHLDGGAHIAACSTTLPANQSAEVFVEHDERSWRVFTHPLAPASSSPLEVQAGARFGALPATSSGASASSMALGNALALSGSVVDKRLVLAQPSAVRVRATSGVCALAVSGAQGANGAKGAMPSASGSASDTWRVVDARGLGSGCDFVRVLPAGTHRVLVRGFAGAPLSGNVTVSTEPVLALTEGVNAEAIVQAGDARTYRFVVAGDGEIGVGLQSDADTLSCLLLTEAQELVGDGCHQFGKLARGTYYLRVEAPPDAVPRRFKPVVFGLQGTVIDVPDAWLREFFARANVAAPRSDRRNP